MLVRSVCLSSALCMMLAAPVSWADQAITESGWLELVKGHLDADSGITVGNVEPGEATGERKITLIIPKARVAFDPDALEEVRVVGRRPEPIDILPDFRYEWVADYDNDNYGLIIHLKDDGSLPLRLYMESSTGFIR